MKVDDLASQIGNLVKHLNNGEDISQNHEDFQFSYNIIRRSSFETLHQGIENVRGTNFF